MILVVPVSLFHGLGLDYSGGPGCYKLHCYDEPKLYSRRGRLQYFVLSKLVPACKGIETSSDWGNPQFITLVT